MLVAADVRRRIPLSCSDVRLLASAATVRGFTARTWVQRNLSLLRTAVLGLSLLLAAVQPHAAEATWKAGTARTIITPTERLWLAGYGSRDKPADGKVTELWLKVLALEDARGHRAVILTSDLLGIPQSIYQRTCVALK